MSIGTRSSVGPRVRRKPRYGFVQTLHYVGYSRHIRRDADGALSAQVMVLAGNRVRMQVKAAGEALEFDFRRQSIRPDLSAEYCRRPGFYLQDVLQQLISDRRRAVLLNGNNIGYWGNQFVIDGGELIYKPKGPLFDDGRLHAHATGDYAFFLDANGFSIADLKLFGTRSSQNSDVNITAGRSLPSCGISGFPLVRAGRAVWREHGELAWDPGLLFDLGPLRGDQYSEIRTYVRQLLDEGAELARHPMTVVGVDSERNIVLLVVTRTKRSFGLSVAQAAELLMDQFDVSDAIVLGAAGDAQLASTEEGFLASPYVASYASTAAKSIPADLLSRELRDGDVRARPVPSYVLFEIKSR